MAQYTALYACGHTGTVRLYGPHARRERTLAYLTTVGCPACERETRRPHLDIYARPWPQNGAHALAQMVLDVTDGYPIKEHLKARGYRYQPEPADGRGMPLTLGLLSTKPPAPVWRKQWGFSDAAGFASARRDVARELSDLRRIAGLTQADVHVQTKTEMMLQLALGRAPQG